MVREATEADIHYVCHRMRAVDAEEQFATRFAGDDTWDALARDMIARMPRAILSFCFTGPDGNPATILSAYQDAPGVARLHRISTDAWPMVSRAVFRFGIESFMPALAQVVHRAECSVLHHYNEAARMLINLGFNPEGVARSRGRNLEDFTNFAWLRPNV